MPEPPHYRRAYNWKEGSCNYCVHLDHSDVLVIATCDKYLAHVGLTSICDSFEDSRKLTASERLKLLKSFDREFGEKMKRLEGNGEIVDLPEDEP